MLLVFLFPCQIFHSRVWGGPLSGHRWRRRIPETIILNRCRYAFVFPCAVTIAVKVGERLMCIFSLPVISTKYSLVIRPIVELSHWCCHLAMDFCLSRRTISLFGILLEHISLLLAASLASLSTSSVSLCPAWAFIHVNSMFQFSFSRAVVFFLISCISNVHVCVYLCVYVTLPYSTVVVVLIIIISNITKNSVSATRAASMQQHLYATSHTVYLPNFHCTSKLKIQGWYQACEFIAVWHHCSCVPHKPALTQVSFRTMFDFPLLITVPQLLHNLQPSQRSIMSHSDLEERPFAGHSQSKDVCTCVCCVRKREQ